MEGPVSTADVDEAIELWRNRGWVIVDGLVPTADIDDAVESDLWDVLPRPDDFHADPERYMPEFVGDSVDVQLGREETPGEGQSFRLRQFLGHRHMPYPGTGKLNRLTVHRNVVDFAKRCMRSDDLRIYQTRIWGKYTGVTNYSQPFHQDRNHNIVPDRLEQDWWNLEGFLYLSDVDDGVAPTQIHGTGVQPDPEAGHPASGIRGSYLAYRPDVWHRGVDLTRPGGSRFLMNVAFKHAGHDWIGYDNPQPKSNQPMWCKFAASCTPAELALFGAPLPGHPYWTRDLVDAMAIRYRGLDVRPWIEALDD